eukprot:UN04695
MFIHVKSLNGNKNQINVDEDATVKQVKLILQEKEGIPAEQLRIIFKGKLLNDTDKLKDKGVEAGMTLHSAIMLRGGC